MSGGSHDYLYSKLALELGIPSGSYNIGNGKYGGYAQEVAEARQVNPMHDPELSEMMYDVSCLLHSLEWSDSCDTSEELYFEDVRKFKEKWFGRTSEQTIQAYREDIKRFTERLIRDIDKAS